MNKDTFGVTLDLSLDTQEEIAQTIERAIEARIKSLGLSMKALKNYHYTLDIPVTLDIKE